MTGLTNGKVYTCTVTATNGVGTGAASPPSGPFVFAIGATCTPTTLMASAPNLVAQIRAHVLDEAALGRQTHVLASVVAKFPVAYQIGPNSWDHAAQRMLSADDLAQVAKAEEFIKAVRDDISSDIGDMLAEHGVDFLAKGGGGTTGDVGGNSAMCAAGLNDLLKTLNDDLSVATDELTAAQALSDAIGGQGTTSAEVVGYSVIAEKGLIGKLKGVAGASSDGATAPLWRSKLPRLRPSLWSC